MICCQWKVKKKILRRPRGIIVFVIFTGLSFVVKGLGKFRARHTNMTGHDLGLSSPWNGSSLVVLPASMEEWQLGTCGLVRITHVDLWGLNAVTGAFLWIWLFKCVIKMHVFCVVFSHNTSYTTWNFWVGVWGCKAPTPKPYSKTVNVSWEKTLQKTYLLNMGI